MSKSNTAVKKSKNVVAISIIAVISCLIIVAAAVVGVMLVGANGKKLLFSVDGQPVVSISVKDKEEIVLPTPEQKDGYTFSGWYFDKDTFTEPCTEETLKDKKIKNGTSVHAKWLKNDYSITYILDSGENAKTNPNGYVIDTATIALVNPFKLGFTFDGWYSEDTFTTKVTEIAAGSIGDKTLFAKWLKNEFSIIYKNLEGATNNALNPGGYDVTTATIALADPSRDGYTFDGWYGEDTFKTKVTEITTGSTGEKTFFARWKAIEYGIVYNLNSGVNAIANPATYTIDNAAALAAPTREGYTFEGWFAKADFSGNAITEIAKGSMDAKTVFAKWSLDNYTINYELNGQFVDNPNAVANYNIHTSTMTLKDASRNGYTFDGWYDANVGGNAVTEIAKGSTGNKTIFARWKVVEYTITYNLDGGENSLANLSKYTIESDTIVFDTPTKVGYTFEGWYDAKAVANVFDKITIGSTGDAKVYARWTATKYTVTYDANGGKDDHGNIKVYDATYDIELMAAKHMDNWMSFDGWYDALTGGNLVTKISKGSTGNKTLFARWDFTGTPNLAWNLSTDGTTWEVARGNVTSGVVGIPSKYGNSDLPVRIKANGFENANGITSVIIEDGVTSIESRAFRNCSALARITIPNSVTSIGRAVFQNGTALTSVVIPNSVTEIAIEAFAGCANLVSVTIPDSVQSILSQAFYLCPKLASVTIPNNVTNIGSSAFNGCTALKSVDIPSKVTEIGVQAFYQCTSLISIDIPSQVTSIGESAFQGCSNLASIYIPKSVDTMGANVFHTCGIVRVYCEIAQAEVPVLSGGKGWHASWKGDTPTGRIKWGQILSTDGLIYEADTTNYKVTGGVNLNGAVTIPATFKNVNVTSLGDYVFYHQNGITSIVVPESVTAIGNNAFAYCHALTSVNIPSGVTRIENAAFYECKLLTSIVIPNNVDFIGSSAFGHCKAFTSVNIPSGLKEMGVNAFYSCTNLVSINIPLSVTAMDINVFDACGKITVYCEASGRPGTWSATWATGANSVIWGKLISEDGFVFQDDTKGGYIVTGHTNPTGDLAIPAKFNTRNVTAIAASAFQNKAGITSVVIPDSVTSIGEYAFQACSYLKRVKLPSALKSMGKNAFSSCLVLESVDIPNSVETIGNDAFYQCLELKSANIPTSLKIVEQCLFQSCPKLTSMIIPNGVTEIKVSVFDGCASLKSINIPDTVKTIAASAFINCTSLNSIYLPNTVLTIGTNAFKGCTNIRIYCEATGKPGGWTTSDSSNTWAQGISDSYIRWSQIPSADGWFYQLNNDNTYTVSGHVNRTGDLVIPATFKGAAVTSIASHTFYNSNGLTGMIIPDSVTSIVRWAFAGCEALTSIVIPNTVETIGDNAFFRCIALTSANIPTSLKILDTCVFERCDSFTSVIIPDNVVEIKNTAFGSCGANLKSVFIPNTVKTMGTTVFNDCSALRIYCEVAKPNGSINPPGWSNTWNGNVAAEYIHWGQIPSADGWFYQLNNDKTYTVSGHANPTGDLDIPAKFNNADVTSIGNYAFRNQQGITSIVIPDSVTSIGKYSISGCTALTSIVIPNGVTTIGDNAFYYCLALTSVNVPTSLKILDSYTFQRCDSLTSIVIPDSVVEIKGAAFLDCANLRSVYIPDSVTKIGSNAFKNCPNIRLHCEPSSAPGGWTTQADNTWAQGVTSDYVHWNQIASEDGWFYKLNADGTYAVAGHVNPTDDIVLPSTFRGKAVTAIDYKAFIYQNTITSVVIPDSVTLIDGLAFYGCTALKSVNIPNGVAEIRGAAFWDCTSLPSVYIPNTVTTIGSNAFKNCTAIRLYCEFSSAPSGWSTSSGNAWNTSVSYTYWKQKPSTDGFLYQVNIDGTYAVSGHSNPVGKLEIPSMYNGVPVTSIADYAFRSQLGITSIVIPDSVTSIGVYSFSGCNGITSINIPNSVTSIGHDAFYNCQKLASANLPNNLKVMSSYIFQNCYALTTMTIPDSVTEIQYGAFYDCTSLWRVNIPISVTTIARNAFQGCTSANIYCEASSSPNGWYHGTEEQGGSIVSVYWYGNVPASNIRFSDYLTQDGLIYERYSSGYCVYSCLKTSGEVVIPSTFNGKPVLAIYNNAFRNNKGITSVVIPDTVTYIGSTAFYNCTSLVSVNIPDSVTTINTEAFNSCTKLPGIYIPNSVTGMGDSAFYNCPSLTIYCEAPSKTGSWNAAWNNGTTADQIKYSQVLSEEDGLIYQALGINGYAVTGCLKTTGEVVIPSMFNGMYVTAIDNSAFLKDAGITSIVLPETVTSIGSSAFQGCLALKSINIPSNVRSIGAFAFNNCEALTSVVIPNGVTSIENGTFQNCKSLTSVTIPDSVTSIGEKAFRWCEALTSVVIPNGVTSIGVEAFYTCSSLTSVNIPNGVTTISDSAFSDCRSLTSMNIPNGVTSIGEYAFRSCSKLASVTIPNSVTSIGIFAFENCGALTSVNIPNSVTSIGVNAFRLCVSLTSVNIPNSVTSIGATAFEACRSLASIFIPNSVATIGKNAFNVCTILTIYCEPISKPSGWDATSGSPWYGDDVDPKTEILWGQTLAANGLIYQSNGAGSYALTGCQNGVGEVAIPATFNGKAVTEIGDRAFMNQAGITSIVIPASVTSIGDSAFFGCAALKSVNIPTGVTRIEDQTFFGCSALAKITIPSGVTSIGAHAFDGCAALTSVVMPTGVTAIGASAFADCTALTSVTIPNTVNSIGASAFVNCAALKSIVIPEGVTRIGDYTFQGCTALTSVNIPTSVTSIGKFAFANCTALTSIFIPEGVTVVGIKAFSGCANLKISCQVAARPYGWNAAWMGDVADANITWNASAPVVNP